MGDRVIVRRKPILLRQLVQVGRLPGVVDDPLIVFVLHDDDEDVLEGRRTYPRRDRTNRGLSEIVGAWPVAQLMSSPINTSAPQRFNPRRSVGTFPIGILSQAPTKFRSITAAQSACYYNVFVPD